MIRIILQGRTGNNLFQYAAGRALAHRHQTELILDGSWADDAHAEQFQHLLRLPLQARYVRNLSLLKRAAHRFLGKGPATFHPGPTVIDSPAAALPALETADDGSLLIGFFQSPRHFSGIELELREELDLSSITLPESSQRFEETLRSKSTVSIHVRRGDYLNIGATQCLGPDYHENAIAWFRQRSPDTRFCIFSDDIPWCRKTFQGNDFLFSDFPAAGPDPMHDLRLMAACHHHIIVNSSYSWWGAWLNPSPTKNVIAPKMWMKSRSSTDFVPDDWIIM